MFAVTPWRHGDELLELRRDLFEGGPGVEKRERAVGKVLAWRARKSELPLLLESTADLVEARLRDEEGALPNHALSLLYATAISRFVTGLLDTHTDLARLALPSLPPPPIPVSLRETRHRIVHRHLPSLVELERAAQESLDWLWEHYWSRLDGALAPSAGPALSGREIRDIIQGVLKTYVKERKLEIKSRAGAAGGAGEAAVRKWLDVAAAHQVKRAVLVDMLVAQRTMLPVGLKLGASMKGAYLVWTHFLTALCGVEPSLLDALLECMLEVLASSPLTGAEQDPVREGLCAWTLHILSSPTFQQSRLGAAHPHPHPEHILLDHVLGLCFTTPTYWTLKLAEALLQDRQLPGRTSWLALLDAAKSGGELDGEDLPSKPTIAPEIDPDVEVSDGKQRGGSVDKLPGPHKYRGLWRPRPIGWIAAEG